MDMYFHPVVSESERRELMASDLYRPMLKFIAKAAPLVALKCIGFSSRGVRRVFLGNDAGLYIASLSYHSGSYNLETANLPLGREFTTQAVSKKLSYIVNTAFNKSKAADAFRALVEEADPEKFLEKRVSDDIVWRYQFNIASTLGDGKYNVKATISPAAANTLLDAYAHGTPEDMLTPELRDVMDKIRKYRFNIEERRALRATRLSKMFSSDKWYVACSVGRLHPDVTEYYLAAFNAYAKTCDDSVAPKILMPLQCYRNLADLPEEVVAKLTMMAVVVKGNDSETRFFDKQKLFPASDVILDGANYMCDIRGSGLSVVTFDR